MPRAKTEYQKALKIFPRHVDALYNLAVVCEKLGQNDEAVEHYKHYLEIRPNDADVWTQLGVRYDESGRKAEAKAAYEKALESNPDFGLIPSLLRYLGVCVLYVPRGHHALFK